MMSRKNALYGTYGRFALLKEALVTASEKKWTRVPDIKDYVHPRMLAFSTMYPNRKIDFAVAFDDIKSCISEVKAIDPEAFITDSRFLCEVNAITQINPKNPIGWIAAVMIYKFAGNNKKARDLIQQGCVECPNNELVWLEAAELELGNANKSKVLIQGLKEIPDSVIMWKAFVELADEKDARFLLQRAVQLCYGSAIRSAIAKLKKVARKIDEDEEILELAIRYVLMQRRVWNLKDEAEFVEPAAFVATYQAIIPNTIDSWECHLIKMALSGNDQREARLEQESKKDSKRKLHSIFDDDSNSSPKDGDYSLWNKKRVKCSEPVPDTVVMYDLPTVGEARGSEVASTSDFLADLNLLDENYPSQLIQEGKLHSTSDQRVAKLEQESKKDSKSKLHSMSNEDWNRGNDQRVARLEQESKKDSKRKLHSMSNEDWDSIPQDGDYPSWNKKRVKYFEPVLGTMQMRDSVFYLTTVGEAESGKLASTSTAVDPEVYLAKDRNSYPEDEDYLSLNKKKVKELTLALDAIPVSGLTAVDPEVYLVGLNLMDEIRSDLQINPNDSGNWIAAARRAESASKIHEARQLIQEGCQMCPKKEDVWLEACRLANTDKAKYVIARGLEMIPKSEKLWMQAAKLEPVNAKKIMVLTNGLDNIPGSLTLKNAVEELDNEEDTNI